MFILEPFFNERFDKASKVLQEKNSSTKLISKNALAKSK
jgi:hypothetical protein